MTRKRALEHAIVATRETHMTTEELAALCVVSRNTVAEACRLGKLKAFRHGRSWLIPRLDGQLYAEAYMRENSGQTWEPQVERQKRGYRETNPTRAYALKVEFPPRVLRLIDAERERRYRETGKRKGNMRSNIIFEAIERMLGGAS